LALVLKRKPINPSPASSKKLGLENTPKIIREASIEEAENFSLAELLVPGATVNVTAVSKGKGTSGVIKRWHFHGGPRTHGQSDRERAPGSIGRGTTPGRVVKGKHMAGHMGNENVTIENLKIHSFDAATGILQITGALPGSRGALAKITITKESK